MDIDDLLGLIFGDDEYCAGCYERRVHNALTAQMYEASIARQLGIDANTTESSLSE